MTINRVRGSAIFHTGGKVSVQNKKNICSLTHISKFARIHGYFFLERVLLILPSLFLRFCFSSLHGKKKGGKGNGNSTARKQ